MKKTIKLHKKVLPLAIICTLPTMGSSKITIENPLQKSWQCTANGDTWKCVQTNNNNADLFKKNILPKEKKQIIADALGWLPSTDLNNICGGYYYQYPIIKGPSNEAKINAQQYQYAQSGTITAEGAVEVRKGNQYLSADKAVLTQNEDKKISNVSLTGNVNLSQPGQLAIGSQGNANITNNTATLDDTYYLIRVRQKPSGSMANLASDEVIEKENNFTGFAHGHADKIIQNSKTNYTLKNATYTTDSPYGNDWILSATTLDLDRESGLGTAYNTLFYAKDIPILYWPYMTFPIDNRRRSGFLYPTAGYNSNSDYYLSTPFYWNTAPNYDLLLTPTIYNHKGVLIGSNFRYLTQTHNGSLDMQYMPHDRIANTDRKALSITDNGQYGRNWSSYFNYQYVGDKDFYNDFDSDNMGLSTQTLLNRQAQLNYNDENWNINAIVQSYDVIDDTIYLANRPYWMMPQINVNVSYPSLLPHMNFEWNNQFTYFYKPGLNNVSQVQGQRYYSAPKLSFPFQKNWGFFIPSITLSETAYSLQSRNAATAPNFSQNQYPDQNIIRSLPIINIDTGLYFDHNFSFNQHNYTQTLEPRLFYTYIPYQNQSNIPLFDTSLNNFSYTSLFQTNVFTGIDRINNANQLAYALETSVNHQETGVNVLSAGIGQIIYFANREVSLCSGTNANCANPSSKIPFYNTNTSDIAAFFNYRFLPHWQLMTNATYNPQNNNIDLQTYQIQYIPNESHIFNIGYQNIKNNYAALTPEQIQAGSLPDSLSQITFSTIWKLNPHWSITGLWSYAFNSRHTTNMFAGIQYDACSWAIRFLAQRYVNSSSDPNNPSQITGPLTNAFIIQFELKGLGGTSESSLDQRLTMIPGYTPKAGFN
ncbi:LPS-assembly protein LptD [Fastidiosibacter lacustris]|uniref:LPS-assembly protein LptD n=1 Tax=Fastidiosibacter lacustris TaxID=2056695 RepID=UPI000E34A003|nr:LPS-assembly protein LptD [Fastidiosibacter lacustris]